MKFKNSYLKNSFSQAEPGFVWGLPTFILGIMSEKSYLVISDGTTFGKKFFVFFFWGEVIISECPKFFFFQNKSKHKNEERFLKIYFIFIPLFGKVMELLEYNILIFIISFLKFESESII